MKTLLYLSLLLLPFNLKAQSRQIQPFRKGNWQAGLQAGYRANRTGTQIQSGYFVSNKLLFGLEASWTRETLSNQLLNSIQTGPLIRYQFCQGKLSPFLSFSYQVGKQWLDSLSISYPSPYLHQVISLSPGLSIQLSSTWRIDLSYRFEYNQSGRSQRFSNQDYTNQRYFEYYHQPRLGISYFINRN